MQNTTSWLERFGPLVLAAVGIVITTFLADNKWGSLAYKGSPQDVAAVLGSLLVVALFLERALAVINDLLFDKDEARGKVNATSERLWFEKSMLASGNAKAFAIASENVPRVEGLLKTALEEEAEVDQKRARLRLGLGFVVAVLIAGVGVRTLGELVEFPTPPKTETESKDGRTPTEATVRSPSTIGNGTAPSPAASATSTPAPTATAAAQASEKNSGEDDKPGRHRLFDWLDILLTAGLLAGGSNGIGRLIDAIKMKPGTSGQNFVPATMFSGLKSYDLPTPTSGPLVSISTPAVTVGPGTDAT